jgi:cobalt/nickel transport system ATP-binding protein
LSFLAVSSLKYHYPNSVTILDDVTFTIEKGEKVAIIGPNGAGKSTLFLLLNGIHDADSGNIHVDNELLTPKSKKNIRKKLGLVFQNPDDQLFSLTVFDDVAFALHHQKKLKEEINIAVDSALSEVGLSSYKDCTTYHLSFGEKKLVSLATVLSYKPSILLFDEPSANLDPYHRRLFINSINNLSQTALIATHDLDLVLDTCTRVLILNRGKICADGSVDKILYDKELLEQNNLELPFRFQK